MAHVALPRATASLPTPPPDAVKKVKEIIRKGSGKKKVNFDKILGEPCNYVFKSGKKKGQACGIRRSKIKTHQAKSLKENGSRAGETEIKETATISSSIHA